MKSIADIRAQRAGLVADAAWQRRVLAENYRELQGPADIAARGIGALAWLGRHPMVIGAGAAFLVLIRPRGMLSLAGRALVAWRALRTVRGLLKESGVTW